MNIETIQSLYNAGCWNKKDIQQLVIAGVITQSQCNSILGIPTAPAEAPTAPAGATATEGIARARG